MAPADLGDFTGCTMSALSVEIPATVDQLAHARALVRRWLREEGLDASVSDDLLAVSSEFLLHAIVRSGGAGTVRLVGERGPRGVRLAVASDPVAAGAPRRLGLPSDPLARGAIGRRMVEQCCDALDVGTGGPASAECWRGVA